MSTAPIAQGPVDVNVRRPRLRVIQQSRNTYLGRYKEHVVEVCKERNDKNWYIVVTGPSGCYCYHGWWRDSTNKTKREAVLEALQGAMLWTPNAKVTGSPDLSASPRGLPGYTSGEDNGN